MLDLKRKYDEFLSETIFYGTHESGVRVYIMPKSGYKKKYAIFATKYGSVDTEFDIGSKHVKIPDGTAHFLEHKMFDMPDGSDAFAKFSKLGANANAFTSFALTAYYFSATENFEKSLENLIEFVQTPCFTQKSIDKEQGIIGQEIKMYDDDPNWRVFFNALDAMYKNNTIKIDIAGTCESIKTIDSTVLNDIYSVFYHPSNMILFVAGDVCEKEIADLIKSKLKKTEKIAPVTRKYPTEQNEINKSFIKQKLSVAVPLFAIGFKDNETNITGDEMIKKEIETQILIGMLFSKSSPLYKKMYEASIINDSFGAQYSINERYSYTLIEGESKNAKAVYDNIIDYIKDAKLSLEDYKAARNSVWGGFVKMFNSTEAVGYNFAIGILNGMDYFNYKPIFESVTFEDVKKRFEKHFTKENSVLSVVEGEE